MGRLIVLTMVMGLACAGAVRAADETPSGTAPSGTVSSDLAYSPQWPAPPDTGAILMRLGVGTVVVLVLCVGSLWVARPWLQKLQGTIPGNSALQITGTVALGNRAVLYLVKVGETQLIAGTDAGGLKSLVALPASFRETLDEQLVSEPEAASPVTFPLPGLTGSAN